MGFDLPGISKSNLTKPAAGLSGVQKTLINTVTGINIFASNPSETTSTGELPSGEVSGEYAKATGRAGEVMVPQNEIADKFYYKANDDGSETYAYYQPEFA